jgi:molybdenum cofactor cytidylyltransferase
MGGQTVSERPRAMAARDGLKVAAVILAAGASTRMGEPKQLLRLGRRTVLEQTIENVRSAGLEELVLVLGSSADAIRQQLPASAFDALRVVVNPDFGHGMASSLRAGLSALDHRVDGALIVLADQPFVRPETLSRIAALYRSSKAHIVIPTYRGTRGNPVLLDRSVFAEVMALEGDMGCRAIFPGHAEGTLKAEVDDPGIVLDIDSRDDYERLQAGISPPQE